MKITNISASGQTNKWMVDTLRFEIILKKDGEFGWDCTFVEKGSGKKVFHRNCSSMAVAMADADHYCKTGELRHDRREFKWLDLQRPMGRGGFHFAE